MHPLISQGNLHCHSWSLHISEIPLRTLDAKEGWGISVWIGQVPLSYADSSIEFEGCCCRSNAGLTEIFKVLPDFS